MTSASAVRRPLKVKSRVRRSARAIRASWLVATFSSEASERRSTSCWHSYATSRHSSGSALEGRAPPAPAARGGGGIDQHAVDDVGEVVAGLAVHRPLRRQVLEGGGDLFDYQVQHAHAAPAADGADALLQAAKIPGRVVQPVRVIDAQAVDLAGGDELQYQAVRDFEDCFVVDAQRRQIVHIKKPPVVDILGRD